MSVFDGVRRHPRAAGIVSLLVLVGAAAVLWSLGRPEAGGAPAGDAFFDEARGTFVRLPSTEIPPVAGKDGGETVVRAVLRREPATLENTLYLFRFKEAARRQMQERVKGVIGGDYGSMVLAEMDGKEVRMPAAGSPWVGAETAEGQRIVGQ